LELTVDPKDVEQADSCVLPDNAIAKDGYNQEL
jgi:hypothetical protein